jgi:hypothetical protein
MTNAIKIEISEIFETVKQMNPTNTAASTLLLGHSGDWWDFWMIISVVLVALAAAVAAVFTTGSVMMHKREAVSASHALEQYKLDTANKVADATKAGIAAGEKAGNAQAAVDAAKVELAKQESLTAEASARAAEANAKAESFRLDIAKANQEAARATETAEREKLARLQLEARLADRALTPQQQATITSRLTTLSGVVLDAVVWGDTPEIQIISGQVLEAIRKAGWTIHTGQAGGGGAAVRGILIGTRAGADENAVRAGNLIVSALQSAGLAAGPWAFEQLPQPAIMFNSDFSGTAPIRLFIGSKP